MNPPTQPTVEEVAEQIALLQERFLTRPKRSNSFTVYAESNADCKAMLALLSALEKDAVRYRYLREHRSVSLITDFFGNGCVNKTVEMVDTAIDLARGQS